MQKEALQQRILEGIPLSREMAFKVIELAPNAIKVSGGHEENVNVHGTAFAGSIYAVCTLAVWGLVYSRLPGNASLVMMNGHIDYIKPVIGEIVVDASVTQKQMEHFLRELEDNGRCTIDTVASVERDGRKAASFSARLHARLA